MTYQDQVITLLTGILAAVQTRKRCVKPKDELPYSDKFLSFWESYPRKEGKGNAWESWLKKKPDLETILRVVAAYKTTDQWKEGPTHIPHPATFLNQRRWEDEPAVKRPMYAPSRKVVAAKCEKCGIQHNVKKVLVTGQMLCPKCEVNL